MARIKIDSSTVIGKIKPMHAVGQAPLAGLGKSYFDNFHYLTEISAPYSRLHDVSGLFGGGVLVDIPNVFRNFDADENDPDAVKRMPFYLRLLSACKSDEASE